MSQTYRSRPDYIILFIVAALLSIGLLMVFSASPTMAMKLGDSLYYLKRHIMALILGSFALYAGYRTDYFSLRNIPNYLIVASFILLILVFVPGLGVYIGGAKRWVSFGFFNFQPSEIAKLALILYAAKELSSKPISSAAIPILGVSIAFALLIFKQPDLGTSIIIMMIMFTMLYLAGIPSKFMLSASFLALAALAVMSIRSTYRMRRFLAYMNPWKDPLGVGFHIIQSLLAVGSGGLLGLGLGNSKQKFFYLPQNYTDFIFAILCEELGLIGAATVIILFFSFVARGMKIVRSAPDAFSMLIASGIVAWIGSQALLNICVVLGIVPTTGIPLPFISYGGTNLVVTMFSVGMLLNISQYRRAT